MGSADNKQDSVFTAQNAVTAAQVATGVIGGANPLMGAANIALTGIGSDLAAKKRTEEIADMFGSGNVRIARQNPAVRKQLKDLDERWKGSMLEAAVVVIGGLVAGALLGPVIGGLLGTFAIPIPFLGTLTGGAIGLVLGSIAGGIIASSIYHGFSEKQAQDPLIINEQIIKLQAGGQAVAPELAFAALASNVSGKAGEHIDKLLKKYTGTEYFTEALGNPKAVEKLSAMMNDPAIDNIIRAQTQMPHDSQNPNKPVAMQYAELMGSGQLQARDMLKVGAGMYVTPPMPPANIGGDVSPEAPILPTRTQAQGRTT